MGWRDFLGGGLFGGYGGYDQLSEEARQRANRRGLMTSGALIMGNSVGPDNMGFMKNISSALLAGREDFESVLEREAQLAAIAERKKKLEDLELEKIRMEEEEKEREFQEWQEKEALRTQRLHTVSSKTGKTVEELQALGEGSLGGLYEDILFPKAPKAPIEKIEGGRRVRVNPDGSEEFIGYLPPEPRQPKEADPDAEEKSREKWVTNYARGLLRDKEYEDFPDPEGGPPKRVAKPRFARYEDALIAAEDAWEAKFGEPPSVEDKVREVEAMIATLPVGERDKAREEAYEALGIRRPGMVRRPSFGLRR